MWFHGIVRYNMDFLAQVSFFTYISKLGWKQVDAIRRGIWKWNQQEDCEI